MADTPQVVFEYSAGNSLSFFTENFSIEWDRPHMYIDVRVDGSIYVSDADIVQRTFRCTAKNVTGSTVNTLNTVYMAGIDYSGAYPRLTTIYFAAATTITNVEVALKKPKVIDMMNGYWMVELEFVEKTTGST